MLKISIIGAECSGKTTLAQQLANHYSTIWVPEYARSYVLNLKHKYTYTDVEAIALEQKKEIAASYPAAKDFVFFDTDLIITKVWFDTVYKHTPNWLEQAINTSGFQAYLLCNTEPVWEPDTVRENGGEMREKLFNTYKAELETRKLAYFIVSGLGNVRFEKALNFVNSLL